MDIALTTQYLPDDYWYRADTYVDVDPELDLVQTVQQLHSSLDPRTVFACYGKMIGKILPIKAVQLIADGQKYTWGRINGLELHRSIKIDDVTAVIKYALVTPLEPVEVGKLYQLESLLTLALSNALKHQRMVNCALMDELTQLGNRYYFRKSMTKSLARAQRKQGQTSLIVIDIDKFKAINDNFGHIVGDDLLAEFANVLTDSIRDTDQAFRIGGDEFVIVAEGDSQGASLVCERILQQLPKSALLAQYGVKCSLGVAQSSLNDTLDTIYLRADNAMYKAKSAGRNRYSVA